MSMKSNYLWWLIAAGLILLGIWYWKGRGMTPTTPSTTPTLEQTTTAPTTSVVVQLTEQNNLGQSGTATFADNAAGKLVVTLALTGGTFTAAQPAHIHLGACPAPGAVKYPLTNVVNGKSVTTLDVSWQDLVATGTPLAVNVHKSAAESKVYTACGDLPIMTSAVTPASSGTGTVGY